MPEISATEYGNRRQALWAGMEAAGFDALVVFYPARIAYLTGFHFVPTERPIALVLGDGYTALVVPAVEKEQAEGIAGVDRVDVYFEYPGIEAPLQRVRRTLADINASPARTAADHDGQIPYWGYRGPRLSDLTGHPVADGELLIEELRRVKSNAELQCIQLACDWAVRGHRRMQQAIAVGRTEVESYAPAELETLREMVAEMPGWRPRSFGGNGITAMFVGGQKTAMPHGFVRGQGIQPGDVLVSGASAEIDGYRSELERTMFAGEPSAVQRGAFESMLALQTHAIELLKPGRPVAEVDSEVRRLAGQLGQEANLRHHTGHSIGLEGHEAPFLDGGDDAILEPGMVFTVEPGIYISELGGFRHSDTVAITATGARVMTPYPRDIGSLIVAGA